MKNSKLLFRIGAGAALIASIIFMVLSIGSPKGNIYMLISMPLLFIGIIVGMMGIDTDVSKGKKKKKKKRY